MSKALYRKYRSKTLDEIVGQDYIVKALKTALENDKLSHAYLFTGPRGVGKTSIARILAHKINNFEYSGENMPLDIIEIDAASNRRIDEIRDLREKVHIAPVQAKYKVYIIDEVHMLTHDSFNALLKTLEEPPAHVIFILATTDAHKIPETILSRTQRYNFRLASTELVAKHLKSIAQLETININQDALNLLARHSGGSLRDALSLLDQVRHASADEITGQAIESILGLASLDLIQSIFDSIAKKDIKTLMSLLSTAYDNGVSASQLSTSLLDHTRQQISSGGSVLPLKITVKLLEQLIRVDTSNRPAIGLELALIEAVVDMTDTEPAKTSSISISQPAITVSKSVKKADKDLKENTTKLKKEAKPTDKVGQTTNHEPLKQVSEPLKETTIGETKLDPAIWGAVLEDLRHSHNTLYSVLRMANIDYSDLEKNKILLQFKFPFHKKRMSENKNQQIVLNKLSEHGVDGCEIICQTQKFNANVGTRLPEPAMAGAKIESSPSSSDVVFDQVKNIFGGAEVLE